MASIEVDDRTAEATTPELRANLILMNEAASVLATCSVIMQTMAKEAGIEGKEILEIARAAHSMAHHLTDAVEKEIAKGETVVEEVVQSAVRS